MFSASFKYVDSLETSKIWFFFHIIRIIYLFAVTRDRTGLLCWFLIHMSSPPPSFVSIIKPRSPCINKFRRHYTYIHKNWIQCRLWAVIVENEFSSVVLCSVNSLFKNNKNSYFVLFKKEICFVTIFWLFSNVFHYLCVMKVFSFMLLIGRIRSHFKSTGTRSNN